MKCSLECLHSPLRFVQPRTQWRYSPVLVNVCVRVSREEEGYDTKGTTRRKEITTMRETETETKRERDRQKERKNFLKKRRNENLYLMVYRTHREKKRKKKKMPSFHLGTFRKYWLSTVVKTKYWLKKEFHLQIGGFFFFFSHFGVGGREVRPICRQKC